MKKLFYILFLFSSLLMAQGLPTRPVFPAGNGTNERFFRIGRHANYIAWDTIARSYFFVDSTVTPHDTIWFGMNKWKDYTVYGKWRFKNIVNFDSTVYLNDNTYLDSNYVLGSKNFVSGWAGSGWKLDYGVTHAGRSTLELHDLWVRGNLNVYELLAHQIQGINGLFFISSSAKIDTVIGSNITFEDPTNSNLCPFAVNDLIIVQRFQPDQQTVVRTAQATVTVVSGKTVTVSVYSGTFHKGDYAVRIGNTTNATRQASIYLAADDSNAPFIDMINGVNSWAAWGAAAKTKLRLGNLSGITDTDFGGALSGYGLYGQNVYLKGKLKITANSDIIGLSANVTITATTAPTTRTDGTALVTGDLWIDSDGLNYRYRWNGTSWVDMNIPYVSTPSGTGLFIDGTHMGYYAASAWQTYIDNTGHFYFKGDATNYISWDGTNFIVRGKITADDIYTGSLTALVERSSATMTYDRGIAGTEAGYWLGKYGLNDYRFFIGSSASKYFSYNNTDLTMVGGTITSGIIQTSTTNPRMIISTLSGYNYIDFTNSVGTIIGGLHYNPSDANGLQLSSNGNIDFSSASGHITISSGSGHIYVSAGNSIGLYGSGYPSVNIYGVSTTSIATDVGMSFASYKLIIDPSGRLTTVNSIAAVAKQVLIGDGSPTVSFTPRLLAMSDLPALTANRVLLSDVSGYISASTVTNTTLGYLDATSSIQTQLNGKQATITGGASSIVSSNLTASKILVSDASGKVAVSTIASSELFTPAYGELYDNDGTSTITGTSPLPGWQKWTATTTGDNANVDCSNLNDNISITSAIYAGKYRVNYSATFKSNTADAVSWGVGVGASAPTKDAQNGVYASSTGVAYTVSGSFIVSLANGDAVALYCFNSPTYIVTILLAELNIVKIAN